MFRPSRHLLQKYLTAKATNLFSHHKDVVDHIFGLSREFLAKFRVLGGNTDGTRVKMALPHHGATHGDQRSCAHAKLICSEQGCHHNIKPCKTRKLI